MPTSRLESGFCAAARIARPSGVKRKKQEDQQQHDQRDADRAELVRGDDVLPNGGSAGNGLGNGLMV